MIALNPQVERSSPAAAGNPQLRRVYTLVSVLVALLISRPCAAAGEAPPSEAVNVFQCTFGEEWDVNYDAWPDRWTRLSGDDYPHYVGIRIQDDKTAPGGKCLRADLDGAAAAVTSPPIRVMPRFSYVFEAQLKNEMLVHSKVVLTLDFCDSAGHVLQTLRSEPLGATKGWRTVRIDHVEPTDPKIDRVVLGLEVSPDAKGDLHGLVSLADVRLARLPRIVVSTNNPSNVYTSLDGVVVECALSGIPERDPEIRYQLLDAHDVELQNEYRPLNGRRIVEDSGSKGDIVDGVNRGPDGYEGTIKWQPKIPDYGYYRIIVRMLRSQGAEGRTDAERELASRTICLVVVPPLPMARYGEFGWTLPHGDTPLSFEDLSYLLPQVSINWVKFPVWFNPNDTQRANDLIRFVELLGASNIETVGIIDEPPKLPDQAKLDPRDIPIAELLSGDSTTWSAMLEPVMARLALRVRWWQLGRDGDTSFVGYPNLNKRIEEVRTTLFRFGQDVRVGVNWDWANLEASAGNVAWDFQQLVTDAPPSEGDFDALLSRPRDNKSMRWVTIDPPPRSTDTTLSNEAQLLSRASELVRRMVLAKVRGADAIIVTDPFNDEHGLMRASGMPGELLLPWRTTSALIGGGEHLGQLRLPNGSENQVFIRPDGQVVMVVWNRTPVDETLYLGEDVRQYDVFGRSTDLNVENKRPTIHVGPTPVFVLGLHEEITRWRMAFQFERCQVPSIFAKPHPNALTFRNFFGQGVGGSMKIVVEQSRRAEQTAEDDDEEDQQPDSTTYLLDRWSVEPPQSTFQLAAGAEMRFPFEIEFRKAFFGKQPVRIDFKLEADQEYEFSVYTDLEVGTEDLSLDVATYLDKEGKLIVEQIMTNKSEQLSDFKCFLRARGHRRQRMQVYRLGKEADRKVYRFGNGRDLIGKEMLLEIEELSGPRELRYRFVAKDNPPPAETAVKKNRIPPATVRERKADQVVPATVDERPMPAAKDVAQAALFGS
jgi:hypothetical protein